MKFKQNNEDIESKIKFRSFSIVIQGDGTVKERIVTKARERY